MLQDMYTWRTGKVLVISFKGSTSHQATVTIRVGYNKLDARQIQMLQIETLLRGR